MTEPPNRSAAPRGGGEAARLAVLSAFGGGAVDLDSIVGIEETGIELRVTDGAGQSAALALDSPAARADLLYRLAEWCAPALEPKIGKLVSGGARLAGAPGEAARESWALALECGVAGALAWLSGQWFLWLAAGIYALIRAFTRIRRIAAARTPIVFLPAGEAAFGRVSQGNTTIPLDRATFDVGAWSEGRAVLSDGTRAIAIPIGGRPGAFLLFAALIELCGTPDDRLVD
jgi:hypothetical protein